MCCLYFVYFCVFLYLVPGSVSLLVFYVFLCFPGFFVLSSLVFLSSCPRYRVALGCSSMLCVFYVFSCSFPYFHFANNVNLWPCCVAVLLIRIRKGLLLVDIQKDTRISLYVFVLCMHLCIDSNILKADSKIQSKIIGRKCM